MTQRVGMGSLVSVQWGNGPHPRHILSRHINVSFFFFFFGGVSQKLAGLFQPIPTIPQIVVPKHSIRLFNTVAKMLEFEVVADTLWMFSFIMEGLETYMKKKELITNYHRYQNMHERVIQDISREQDIFHSSCQAFMKLISDGCGLTEDDISAMLHDPNHYYWQDEDISLALKGGGRNSSSFGAYLELVDSIKDQLEYVLALADLHEDALVCVCHE